jgi:hypothetical protein
MGPVAKYVSVVWERHSEGPKMELQNLREGEVMVNVDVDAAHRILGLEVVGVHNFNLKELIEVAGLSDRFPQEVIDRAKYTRSDTAPRIDPVLADAPE